MSTIATVYCTASPLPICVHFSQLSTQLHASSPPSASSTTSPTPWSTCTGYQSANASNSSCAHWLASASAARRRPTWLTCVSLCRRCPVALICVLPFTVHDLVVPRTRLAHYGPRSFAAISGPATWNSLPPDLRDMSLSAASFFNQLRLNCSS